MCPLELIDFRHEGRQLGRASRRGTRAYLGERGASGCCSRPCAGRPSQQRRGTRPGRRSNAVLKQLKTTSEFAVEDYFHPVAIEAPRAMPAGIHLATFVAALMETLEYGVEGAPPVCKQRVATLRSELEQVQKLVDVYLRRYFHTLAGHSMKVRQLLLSNMNICLHEGMKAVAVQGCEP